MCDNAFFFLFFCCCGCTQEAVIAELREEMQKLSNYETAVKKAAEMEALDDEGKGAQVCGWQHFFFFFSFVVYVVPMTCFYYSVRAVKAPCPLRCLFYQCARGHFPAIITLLRRTIFQKVQFFFTSLYPEKSKYFRLELSRSRFRHFCEWPCLVFFFS